jgi:hypothetical protein
VRLAPRVGSGPQSLQGNAYNAGVTPNGIARVSNHVATTTLPAAAKD